MYYTVNKPSHVCVCVCSQRFQSAAPIDVASVSLMNLKAQWQEWTPTILPVYVCVCTVVGRWLAGSRVSLSRAQICACMCICVPQWYLVWPVGLRRLQAGDSIGLRCASANLLNCKAKEGRKGWRSRRGFVLYWNSTRQAEIHSTCFSFTRLK